MVFPIRTARSPRSRIRLATVLAVIAALLALPTAAQAGLTVTSPRKNATVNPGSTLVVKFRATCPVGKACGTWETYNVFQNLLFEATAMNQANKNFWHDEEIVHTRIDSTTARIELDDEAAAGKWQLTTNWTECPPTATPHPGPGFENCTQTKFSRNFFVRPTAGSKDDPPYFVTNEVRGAPRGVANFLSFECNAPTSAYRTDLTLQVQSRVGKRMVWKSIASSKQQRFKHPWRTGESNPDADVCALDHKRFRVPSSISTTTKLRTVAKITTKSFSPSMRPKTVFTKPYTLKDLARNSGGGITIN